MTSPHTIVPSSKWMYKDRRILEIDTRKSKYFGVKWHDLSSWQKRKFENVVIGQYAKGSDVPEIVYKT